MTKNANGDPVFAEPKPMCTIRAPKGHNVWVKIELNTLTTKASDYMALGIKKWDEEDYYDVLYTGNSSRYVDVLETDVVELVPLASSTPLSTKYTAVKAGDTAKITGTDSYDFGSVYRVSVSIHDSQWLTDQACDFNSIHGNDWLNYGKMGIGPVTDQDGKVHENQLFAVNRYSKLAYSSDGAHWTENGSVGDQYWDAGPVYGNGIWCAIAYVGNGVRRSTDGGKTWSGTLANVNTYCLNFANGVFMTVTNANPGIVYTSPDAEIWTQIGSVTSGYACILIYGADKWLCGSYLGYVYQSKDNGKTWEQISNGLHKINAEDDVSNSWLGGCYVNGYFYVIRTNGVIARSLDGVEWKKVFSFDNSGAWYYNITYYKNKLWAFDQKGQKYVIGLFNPDGTIDSIE